MFVNATMLAGLAGAMLPLVLHLLSRARYRNVQWGAMMFLTSDDGQVSRGTRLHELSLLVLRMGIVALLAVAMARPVLAPHAGAPDEPACVVVVVDRSGSMALDDNGQQRINPARRAVLGILAGLRRGDEAALVYAPEWPQHPPLLTSDLAALAAQAAEARPNPARADLRAALESAAQLLNSSRSPDKRVIIVCDRQASSWRDITDSFGSAWRVSVRGEPHARPPRLSVIPVGSLEGGNVAIESVQPLNAPIIRDTPAEIEVRVHNYDTQGRPVLPLSLRAGGSEIYQTSLHLEANQTLSWRCPVKFTTGGSTVISARIGGSDLGNDDFFECALEVMDPIKVLVISGDERGLGQLRSESQCLRLALAPFAASGQRGTDPADVQVVPADSLPPLDRALYRVVVLANVPRLGPDQVRQLEQFVYSGGGLLIAPGHLCRVEDYDALLWRDGSGVMPAELDEPTPPDDTQATALLGVELSHPLFRFLQGRPDPVPEVSIRRHFPVRGGEGVGQVLGRYASGRPFIVEGTFGRGRVLLFTTPLDADWSNLPLTSFYLPMVQSAVRYLALGSWPDRNVSAGEPLAAILDDAIESRAELHGPGDFRATVDLVRVGEAREARFVGATRAGIYRLEYKTALGLKSLHFYVKPAREESDLSALDGSAWMRLGQALGLELLEYDQPQAAAAALAGARRRTELWPVLIAAVIGLAVLEVGLARAWTGAPEVRP
jgi:hypothetical protein